MRGCIGIGAGDCLCVCVCGGGGGGQPLRTALQNTIMSLQNSFCESHTLRLVSGKALRAVNARWALPVYPVVEDAKSNGFEEKSVKQKIAT